MYDDDDLRIIERPSGYDSEREIRLYGLLSQCISDYVVMQDARDGQGMLSAAQMMIEVGWQAHSPELRWDVVKALEAISGRRWWESANQRTC